MLHHLIRGVQVKTNLWPWCVNVPSSSAKFTLISSNSVECSADVTPKWQNDNISSTYSNKVYIKTVYIPIKRNKAMQEHINIGNWQNSRGHFCFQYNFKNLNIPNLNYGTKLEQFTSKRCTDAVMINTVLKNGINGRHVKIIIVIIMLRRSCYITDNVVTMTGNADVNNWQLRGMWSNMLLRINCHHPSFRHSVVTHIINIAADIKTLSRLSNYRAWSSTVRTRCTETWNMRTKLIISLLKILFRHR